MTIKGLIILIAILFISLLIIAILGSHLSGWMYDKNVIHKSTQHINIDNDILRIDYQQQNDDLHPDQNIDMYCSKCNQRLFALFPDYGEKLIIEPKSIDCIYKSKYMRAYRYRNTTYNIFDIFWISNNHKYCGGRRYGLDAIAERYINHDSVIQTQFYPFVKYMISSKKWDFYMNFIDFQIQAGDPGSIKLISRYAKGQFTKDELRINTTGYTSREEIINYSKQLLQKYHK